MKDLIFNKKPKIKKMQIIWWEKPNGDKVYLKSHNIANNTLATTLDVQEAEEISNSNLQAAKDWLVNQIGIDENKIHSGTKPPH